MKPLKWIIYTLTNPRTAEIRYVGWTRQSANRRLNTHIQEAVSKPATTHRTKWILSLLSIGMRPLMDVIECGSGEGWAEAERRWIARFREQGARLVNATDGGEGTIGFMPSARARELSSQRRKGKPLSPEHLAKWQAAARAANLGRPLSQEHRAKLSKIQKGKKRPASATAAMVAASLVRIRNGISAETRERQAAVKRGKIPSAETRAKMSAARLGKRHSAETRANIGAGGRRFRERCLAATLIINAEGRRV